MNILQKYNHLILCELVKNHFDIIYENVNEYTLLLLIGFSQSESQKEITFIILRLARDFIKEHMNYRSFGVGNFFFSIRNTHH